MLRAFTALAIATGVFISFSCKEGNGIDEASAPSSAPRLAPEWVSEGEGIEAQPLAPSSRGAAAGKRFVRLGKEETGIEFHNQLDRKNIKNYLLSGAGLAVGDVDGNGLPDLFLVSQDGPNKLYMQRAPWRFEDCSEEAGIVDTNSWGSGAAFADIDNDGSLDLYVCNKGAYDELYLNQGDGTFKGGGVGGGDPRHRAPTMAAFADYDQDGDLDFYRTETRLLSIKEMFNHKVLLLKDEHGVWQAHPSQAHEFEMVDGVPRELGSQDRLFRNDGLTANGMPKFVESTGQAGIKIEREHGSMAVWWDGLAGLDSPVAAVPGEFSEIDSAYLMRRYAELSGADLGAMSWYLGFAFFKLAAIFEGIHYRFQQGGTVGEGFDRIGALVEPMTAAGHRELDR